MKNRGRNILVVLLGILGLTMFTGCQDDNQSAGEDDLPVIRVATMPFVTSLPNIYIEENNLDEEAGFKMDTTAFSSGAPMNEALAADEWDIGAMGAAAITGIDSYDMMVIGEVLQATDGQAIFAKPDSPIAQVEGENPEFPEAKGDAETVTGSTIALPVGTAQHFTVLKWLEALGLEEEDVNIVNMDSAQAYQSLEAGEVDLVSLNIPTFLEADNDGMVQVGNLAKLGTSYVDMVVSNRKFVENEPELTQKYIDVFYEATEALEADKDAAADLMFEWLKSEGSEVPLENVKQDLETVSFISRDEMKDRNYGAFAKEMAEFYVDEGLLEEEAIEKVDENVLTDFVK